MSRYYSQCTDLQKKAIDAYTDKDVVERYRLDDTTEDQLGDTLFAFVVREAGEAEDEDDLVGVLDGAWRQLFDVMNAVTT